MTYGVGGVNQNLAAADVDRFLHGEEGLASVDQVIDDAHLGLDLFYNFHDHHRDEVDELCKCVRAQHVSCR